jgi:hypothetical protein
VRFKIWKVVSLVLGREVVHSYDGVGVIISLYVSVVGVEDSVFSFSEIGRGGPKGCIFDCPVCFPVVAAYIILKAKHF